MLCWADSRSVSACEVLGELTEWAGRSNRGLLGLRFVRIAC